MFGFRKKGAKSVESGAEMCSSTKNSASNCASTKSCSKSSKGKK